MTTEPLQITLPGISEGDEGILIEVIISPLEKGTYIYETKKLDFALTVDKVRVGGEILPQLPVITFRFEMIKK